MTIPLKNRHDNEYTVRETPDEVEYCTEYQAFLAEKLFQEVASGFNPGPLNPALFPFQEVIVRWALRRGRAALFEAVGLGKTIQQCVWAEAICKHTGGDVLILAPLCVAQQTVEEAAKFGIAVRYCRNQDQVQPGITITNYEMLEHFDPAHFVGVVLDESSCLKDHTSVYRNHLIEAFGKTPYRLACTATPSPNDYMELGSHAEFLGIMTRAEMLAMFFCHDGGKTQEWRLKGHGKKRFWEWLSTFAVCIRRPSDLGPEFSDDGYILPPLNIHYHMIESPLLEGELLPKIAATLSERRQAKKQSLGGRCQAVADLVNHDNEQWLVWSHLNAESAVLAKLIPDAVEVKGADSISHKEKALLDFAHGSIRVLVTKPSIAGAGMNLQNAHKMAFVGLDDSFESWHQAIGREYRFGQKYPVDVHIFGSEAEGAIKANVERKQKQFVEMQEQMVIHMNEFTQRQIEGAMIEKAEYQRDIARGAGWELHLGDCVDIVSEMAHDSVDYTIFSPPFSSIYTYSNSDRDMGNCKDDKEFYKHFLFLVKDLLRVTKPGRLLSFHCMNLPNSKFIHGHIGIQDFRGELIRMFVNEGWIFHSEVCIWKDPVTAMHRTKALGLLWKQLKKDSAMSRQGIPDYLVTMRKPGDNPKPISHSAEEFPVKLWQRYASPVWFDINQSRTLQFRNARGNDDERHIAPLQLDVIERALALWSAPGDLVFSPFAGIGSEGHVAIQMNRRFVGVELKPAYWHLAASNLRHARQQTQNLFADLD